MPPAPARSSDACAVPPSVVGEVYGRRAVPDGPVWCGRGAPGDPDPRRRHRPGGLRGHPASAGRHRGRAGVGRRGGRRERAVAREGTPLPDRVLESIRRTRVALKGPITTPVGTGFRSVNVALRHELDLFAAVRPSRSLPGVPTRYPGVDLVVIRENTEDLYAGIEFERGAPETEELRRKLEELGHEIREDAGVTVKPISVTGARRIVRFAFEFARAHGRASITARPQGEHHAVLRWAVPADLPGGGRRQRGRRIAGDADRPPLDAADPLARGLRPAAAAEPVRRHPVRPVRRPGRRFGLGSGGQPWVGVRGVRARARERPGHRRDGAGEPGGHDPVRSDAPATLGGRRLRPDRWSRRWTECYRRERSGPRIWAGRPPRPRWPRRW